MVEVRALRDYNLNDFDIDKGNNFVLDRSSVVGKGVVNKECYSWLSNSRKRIIMFWFRYYFSVFFFFWVIGENGLVFLLFMEIYLGRSGFFCFVINLLLYLNLVIFVLSMVIKLWWIVLLLEKEMKRIMVFFFSQDQKNIGEFFN